MRIFLDTNVFLSILNKEKNWRFAEKLLLDINKGNHTGYTSVISVSEILSGFYAEGEAEKGEMFITDLRAIGNIVITDVNLHWSSVKDF
ncbi:PIN domain protein [uncultured archaeon]|nr:PIN domain protein [uncultured archaeon]